MSEEYWDGALKARTEVDKNKTKEINNTFVPTRVGSATWIRRCHKIQSCIWVKTSKSFLMIWLIDFLSLLLSLTIGLFFFFT